MAGCARNFCFSSAVISVGACSRCDLQKALGTSTLRFAAGGVGVVLADSFSSPTSLPILEVTSQCCFAAGPLGPGLPQVCAAE